MLGIVCSAVSTAAPVPKEAKSNKLDGVWELTAMEVAGTGRPVGSTLKIEEKSVTVTSTGENADRPPRTYVIAINDIARPRELDWNSNVQGIIHQAIFAVEGDSLKIAMNLSGKGRPTEMKSGDTTVLYTFKRLKN